MVDEQNRGEGVAAAAVDERGVVDGPAEAGDPDRQARRRAKLEQIKAELVGGELFSAAEVADVLDVHPRTVNDYVREGKLKAIQVGGGWKISERALRSFVRDLTTDEAQQRYLAGAGPVTAVAAVTPRNPKADSRGGKRSPYKCSFCGKMQEQVRRLIAGPGGVYICDACIALCNGIIAKEAGKDVAGAARGAQT